MIANIPLGFKAKAMSTRLLSFALGVVSMAVVLVYFDNSSVEIFSIPRLKNDTSALTDEIQESTVIPLPGGAIGPESFSFDGNGDGPYTGVSDGRIIRWRANESRWVDFAVTSPIRDGCEGRHDHSQTEHICGRPLGLRFNEKTGDLYITDAYMGLLVVGPNGGLASPLAQQLDGLAFGFTNSLDIDHNTGVVYFTDSSTRFPRRNYVSVIISGDDTGRLMKFDPVTKKTTLLLNNLKFPNGVALSKNGDFLLFVETTTCRLFKFWLKSPKAGNLEVLAQLPGFPDNVKRNRIGEFWVGINSRRGKLLEWVVSNSWIGNGLIRVSPVDVTKVHSSLGGVMGGMGMGVRLDEDGNVVEALGSGKGKRWKFVSEVEEYDGNLWVGSVTRSFVIKQKLPMSLDSNTK
ncbi:UNVERIFIED_CONTAM: protein STRICTOSIDINE SYNTHASE-LIKE 2 [Sesamum angustifolium]|uniref:Protein STRICTOSIDINE SYNTHASE-LIKE 2 n=1 Tax=Sesamum angustifolium TaxID=2727405 RepID=A0AAW2PVW0_9LAMI